MLNQEIIFGISGQSFFFDPPDGRPSSPSVQVFNWASDDDGTQESATTGSCSVDSVDTTFSASAGAQSIEVADGTGIKRRRRYLVTDLDGDCEWVEVLSINGTTVGLRQPLKNDYANGSAFQGCRISIAVDSTWVATKSKISDILELNERAWRTDEEAVPGVPGAAGYRLRWVYTVNDAQVARYSFADLVRNAASNLVTPLDVDNRFPGWIDRLPPDYQEDQGAALVEEAFRAVKMDAMGDAQVIRRIRNTEVLRELTIYRANMLAVEAALYYGASNPDQIKASHDAYQARYDMLMREPKVPTDQTGGGSSAQPQRLPVFRR